MKKSTLLFASLLTALFSSNLVFADTIELSNGKKFDGTFSGRDGDTIKFNVDGIDMSFQAKDVKNIAMGSSAKTTTVPTAATPTKQITSGPATIAAGTTLTIKLSDTLNSGKQKSGHKFAAILEGALVSNGVTVAAAGSKVYGVITKAKKAGRLAGKAKIIIMITDININGQITPVSTSAINATTKSTGKSTVGKVATGAAIGGLAKGSSGASDGAKIGLGIALLTRGNQVVVPAGTLLDFKLTQPLTSK